MSRREPEQLRLELPHIALAAQAWGPAEGAPVLALHGWLDNAGSFTRLAPQLEGCRVLALDLAGHGWSGHRPAGAAYQLWDYLYDILLAADRLGWQRFALLGHSMGASIAVLFAATFPERVTRLALIDGALPLTEEPETAPARLSRAFKRLARLEGRSKTVYAEVEQAIVARMRAEFPVSREAAEHLIARGLEQVPGGYRWRCDPRLLMPSPVRLTPAQVQAFVDRVECPVRLVLGEQGLYPSAAEREALAALGWSPQVLRGGHHLHLDDSAGAAAVAERFRDFLRD